MFMYNGIGVFKWDVFSYSFFPTEKTKALNVPSFHSEGAKVMR